MSVGLSLMTRNIVYLHTYCMLHDGSSRVCPDLTCRCEVFLRDLQISNISTGKNTIKEKNVETFSLHKWQMIADEKQPKAPQWEVFPGSPLTHVYYACQGIHYLSGSHLVAIRVHGGQNVNARVMDQPHDPLVSGSVLLAEKLGELNEELTAEHFVAVHVAHVLELWLHWGGSGQVKGGWGGDKVKKSTGAVRRDI